MIQAFLESTDEMVSSFRKKDNRTLDIIELRNDPDNLSQNLKNNVILVDTRFQAIGV